MGEIHHTRYTSVDEAMAAINRELMKYAVIDDALGHERAVSQSEYEAKRTEAIEKQEGEVRLFDDVNDREHFKRVFAAWDFSEGTY